MAALASDAALRSLDCASSALRRAALRAVAEPRLDHLLAEDVAHAHEAEGERVMGHAVERAANPDVASGAL
jgi:hypothetical protein